MTSNVDESPKAQAGTTTGKAHKKATAGARRTHGAPRKGKAGKRAKAAQKTPQAPQRADGARAGSKAAQVLELLKRAEGVTLEELMKATGWQPHSVRGFLSGTLRKKMALTVTSTKGENGERTYSVKS